METESRYFSESDVETVTTGLMDITKKFPDLASESAAGSRAAYAINSVRILESRLGISSDALRFIYTDPRLVPEPICRFMNDYLAGNIPRERASTILTDLQKDMRQYCFAHHIPAADPNDLGKTVMPLMEMIPGYAEKTTAALKSTLRRIIDRYVPNADREAAVGALYANALQPTNSFDIDALARGVAEVILPGKYLELMLQIGAREPTPQELAGTYWEALHVFYEQMGIKFPTSIDKSQTLEARLVPEIVTCERERYRQALDRLKL